MWTEPGQDPAPQGCRCHLNCCVQTTRGSWTIRAWHSRPLRTCTPGFAKAGARPDLQAAFLMLLQLRRGRVRKRDQVTITWIRFCFKINPGEAAGWRAWAPASVAAARAVGACSPQHPVPHSPGVLQAGVLTFWLHRRSPSLAELRQHPPSLRDPDTRQRPGRGHSERPPAVLGAVPGQGAFRKAA